MDYTDTRVMAVCENKLGVEFRKTRSPEMKGKVYLDGKYHACIIVRHGRKSIPKGTCSSMARQLGLTSKDFGRLIDCPMSTEEYFKKTGGAQSDTPTSSSQPGTN